MKDAKGHGSNGRGGTTPQYAQHLAQRSIRSSAAAHQTMVNAIGRAPGWGGAISAAAKGFMKDTSGAGQDLNEHILNMTTRANNPEDLHDFTQHVGASVAEGMPSMGLALSAAKLFGG
jgi:hypothetical protein